jgi:hypothetical protein
MRASIKADRTTILVTSSAPLHALAKPQPLYAEKVNLSRHYAAANQSAQRFAGSCPLRLPAPTICPFGGVCHSCPARVQAKLEVSRPDDPYEQEADRVADRVAAMPEPKVRRACPSCKDGTIQPKPLADQITPLLQRQEKNPEEDEEPVQAKDEGYSFPRSTPGASVQIRSLQGGGAPLPFATRAFFERRFGSDFGDVRVHSGPSASQAARSIRAQAFTLGRDIVFGQDRYAPDTRAGRSLLAHELTHVIQQTKPDLRKRRDEHAGEIIPPKVNLTAPSTKQFRRRGRRPPKWIRKQGDIWKSNRPFATLEELAQLLGMKRENWMCIRPTLMKYPAEPYWEHISLYDEFDVSNLTKTKGPAISGHELVGDHADWAQHFYGVPAFSQSPGQVIAQKASGNHPIQSMLLIGHANNVQMGGFDLSNIKPNQPRPTYARAFGGNFPNRCSFTRNARVRLVGCSSMQFGNRFAAVYMRRPSHTTTTTRSVCMHVIRNRRYIVSNVHTGQIVSSTPLPNLYRVCFSRHYLPGCHLLPARLSPLYTTPRQFHNGPYWAQITGPL